MIPFSESSSVAIVTTGTVTSFADSSQVTNFNVPLLPLFTSKPASASGVASGNTSLFNKIILSPNSTTLP